MLGVIKHKRGSSRRAELSFMQKRIRKTQLVTTWRSFTPLEPILSPCWLKSPRPGWFVTLHMTKNMHPDQVWLHLKRETGFSCLMDVSVFPLQHLEVFNWFALNLISNKTRCSASLPGSTTVITQERMLFCSRPLISRSPGALPWSPW